MRARCRRALHAAHGSWLQPARAVHLARAAPPAGDRECYLLDPLLTRARWHYAIQGIPRSSYSNSISMEVVAREHVRFSFYKSVFCILYRVCGIFSIVCSFYYVLVASSMHSTLYPRGGRILNPEYSARASSRAPVSTTLYSIEVP